MRFIFGDDWNDVLCKSLFWYLAMITVISLGSRPLKFRVFIHAYSLRPQTLFPVVAKTRTKSIQKQIKSIDVDKVGSIKKALTAAFHLACLEIRSRNQEAINSTKKHDLLTKGFLLPAISTSILFICFWIDLVRVLATTGNTSAVAGYTRV